MELSFENHFNPATISESGRETKVLWSKKPEGKLLIFVHGFKGAAVTTWGGWGGMAYQLCLHKETAGYDLVFFGYASTGQHAGDSTLQLQDFLDNLLAGNTAKIINKSLDLAGYTTRRNSDFKYTQVVLAAHSLGACVSRRAMLNQIIQTGSKSWPNKFKLVLYAPAHRGARLHRLRLAAFMRGIISVDYRISTVFELKEDSDYLKELLSQTLGNCDSKPRLNSPLTFWANDDKVVINGEFAKDAKPVKVTVNGTTHVSICKGERYDITVSKLMKEL